MADSSLASDRATKTGMYARGNIAEYWIVNLPDRVVEVYCAPGPSSGTPLGHAYNTMTRHGEAETVSPLFAPTAAVTVADLLP